MEISWTFELLRYQCKNVLETYNLSNTFVIQMPLHFEQECFQPFNVAMGLQSHSPLKKNFDRVVSWIVEAGLMKYWFEETLVIAKKVSMISGNVMLC